MKNFTVWFRVGMDFREEIEAEDISDAERRIRQKVWDLRRDYMAVIAEEYRRTHIYDVVEGVPDE